MNLSRAAPLDVIGVGFGPSNLALAIALEELAGKRGRHLDALFLERQADYHWHGDTLVAHSEMQISFLKDLVSLRDPTSFYSFVNYLHRHDRLVDFINLGTFYPCRMEYNDYLRWVGLALHAPVPPRRGGDGGGAGPRGPADRAPEGPLARRARVRACAQHPVRGRQHGRDAAHPCGLRAPGEEPRLFHHAHYLKRMAAPARGAGQPMRVAVVGGGQSAAEAFIDLNDSHPAGSRRPDPARRRPEAGGRQPLRQRHLLPRLHRPGLQPAGGRAGTVSSASTGTPTTRWSTST